MGSIYDLPLGIFQKIFLILYMCVCLWVCSHMCRCPWSPEEGDSQFLELELQEVVSQPTWALETELGSFAGQYLQLNAKLIKRLLLCATCLCPPLRHVLFSVLVHFNEGPNPSRPVCYPTKPCLPHCSLLNLERNENHFSGVCLIKVSLL